LIGFFLGRIKPKASEKISLPLIRYGIPLSVMGLLLKVGINIDLIKSSLIAFSSISFLFFLINVLPNVRKKLPNYSLQLGGLIGNTSFLGIPIAIALLPTNTINFTIGFDLGTTLFAWIFGPILLQKEKYQSSKFNINELTLSLFSSPASKGILGALLAYLISLDDYLGKVLWIPARIVIILAIVVVGSRLGIITKSKNKIFELKNDIRNSIILKLLIFPLLIFVITMLINFEKLEVLALVLQAGTPSAISTILMAEAYKTNQGIAAQTLFLTTIFSIITIPVITFLLKV
tara:strand:- start:363 stop:1232 length:870 start_codon:yes stop_codon:yes gene_type:complete